MNMSKSRDKGLTLLAAAGVLAGACSGGSGAPDASAPDAEAASSGRVVMSWTLVDGDEPIECDEVGALSVALTAIPLDGFAGEVRTRRCADGEQSVAFDMAPGAYTARAELLSSAGVIGDTVRIERLDVAADGEVVLDPITFDVPRLGGASFRVQVRPFNDNCEEDGSPPLEELILELHERGGDCVPVTFEIDEPGGEVERTYGSDCAGASIECVEHVQRIAFSDVEPGRYLLDVLARDEGGTCFGLLNQFEVVGGGLDRALGTLLLRELESCDDFVEVDAGVPDAGVDDDAGLDAGVDDDADPDDGGTDS
jgi:hypothetical protein